MTPCRLTVVRRSQTLISQWGWDEARRLALPNPLTMHGRADCASPPRSTRQGVEHLINPLTQLPRGVRLLQQRGVRVEGACPGELVSSVPGDIQNRHLEA